MIKRLVMLLAMYCSVAAATEVVVNKNAQVAALPSEEVRAIFTLRRSHWDNGLKIKLFLLPRNSVITKQFTYQVLKMPPNMYFDILESNYNLGKTNIPVVLDTEHSMLLNLSINPGSIGYVFGADILLDAPNLRVLKVQD